MAGPVEEVLAVALAVDDVAGRPVDRLGGRPPAGPPASPRPGPRGGRRTGGGTPRSGRWRRRRRSPTASGSCRCRSRRARRRCRGRSARRPRSPGPRPRGGATRSSGPTPTIANSASSWPSARSRSRTSSARRRPRSARRGGRRAIWSTTRSAAAPASRSSSISSGSFTIRSSRRTPVADAQCAPGSAAWSRRRWHRPAADPRHATVGRRREPRAVARTRSATRPCGSSVSIHVAIVDRRSGCRPGRPAPRAGARRATGAAAGDDGEHRQALERHRPVAGQVVEVRPDPDQGGGEAALRRRARRDAARRSA